MFCTKDRVGACLGDALVAERLDRRKTKNKRNFWKRRVGRGVTRQGWNLGFGIWPLVLALQLFTSITALPNHRARLYGCAVRSDTLVTHRTEHRTEHSRHRTHSFPPSPPLLPSPLLPLPPTPMHGMSISSIGFVTKERKF